MKKILAVLLFSTITFTAQAGITSTVTNAPAVLTQQAPADSAELARSVAALMPLEEQVDAFAKVVAQTLPAEKQALFISIMKKNVDVPTLRTAAAQALVKTYTVDELNTMKEMYSKPGSKEVIAKMDNFSEAMKPAVEAMVIKGVNEARKAGVVPAAEQEAQ